jgi:transposase
MEFEFFIGIDVSKNELDFSIQQGKCFLFHREIANNPTGINALIKELGKLPGFSLSKTIFCMEHTGIYNNHLLGCLHTKKANICLEAATQIKRSLGNIRGKNDKIDSVRIAEYAYKNREALSLWAPKRAVVQQLAYLASTRSRLIKIQKIASTALNEYGEFVSKKMARQNIGLCQRTINATKADMDKVEKAIALVIAGDAELKRLFGLATSVCGVGSVVATQMLITTNEFKDIANPRQFACFAGVAPFTSESGMYKGKGRVSHMANKKMKTLLHLAAMVAIQYSPELKLYYDRMVKQEKKNKMSVINAVRNKLVLRVFACVNQNRKYEKIYSRLVA